MAYYISKTINRPFDAVVTDVTLGACNPRFAHEALQVEDKLGVLLPCNVIVRETSDHKVEVASIDPVASMERTGNPALSSTAEEVHRLLSKVISQIGS